MIYGQCLKERFSTIDLLFENDIILSESLQEQILNEANIKDLWNRFIKWIKEKVIPFFKKIKDKIKNKFSKNKENSSKNDGIEITNEFKDAVKNKKIIILRIMLKDSLLVDTSFSRFNKELKLAETIDGLWDEHDNDKFETNKSKWNEDYMNEQMVKVVTNFSHERINHLKEVVNYIYNENKENKNKISINREEKLKSPIEFEYYDTQKGGGFDSNIAKISLDIEKAIDKIISEDKNDNEVGSITINAKEVKNISDLNNILDEAYNNEFPIKKAKAETVNEYISIISDIRKDIVSLERNMEHYCDNSIKKAESILSSNELKKPKNIQLLTTLLNGSMKISTNLAKIINKNKSQIKREG